VVTQDALSHSLNLFNASSDYKATAEFVAGEQFGISDLNISIADVNPVQYWTFAEVNRHNTTPSNLVALGIKLSPASSRGGQVEAATLRTTQSETVLASTSWPLGVSGWRAGAHASRTQTRTRLEADDGADGITIKGKATSLGLEASHLWALSESTTLKAHATWARNDFGSSLGSEKLTGKQLDKFSLGGTLEHFTTATQSWFKMSSVFTKEQQGSDKYTEFAGATLIHLDQNRQWAVKFSGYGRLSRRGEDFDAEPFAIGGQDSVRGYTSASVASRQGHAFQTELRFRPAIDGALPMELLVFWDAGKVRSEEEARRISSAGIGMQARLTHQMSFDLLYSRQLKLQEPLPNRWMARLTAYW
jgi:hemolysin activation/secretion protein